MASRKPKNDAEWARRVEKRLKDLESPRSMRMGNWMISVSDISGSLVADHIPTGRRTILADAEPKYNVEKNEDYHDPA